jgi:hypothetical protein
MSRPEADSPGEAPVEEADSERGAVYVLAAAAIVVLLGMAAMSVDIGWIFLNDVRAQRAADAAALAGVTHLPAEEVEAFSVAKDIAAENGYTEGGGVTVTPERAGDQELRVRVRDTGVETFFMRVFGIDTVAVSGNARARYVIPVPLGSPENFFGADPTVAGRGINDASGPGFWAAINLPHTLKQHGDPYATQCYTTAAGNESCNVANGQYYGSGPGGDPDGYWYAVEVPSGTSSLTVSAFDADFFHRSNVDLETGEQNLGGTSGPFSEAWGVRVEATVGTFTLTFDGATTAPLPFDAASVAVQNALLALPTIVASPPGIVVTGSGTVANPWNVTAPFGSVWAGIDLPDDLLTADGSGLTDGSGPTGTVTVDHIQDGAPATGLPSAEFVFEVYDPDGSPFDYRNNPLRCRVTVDGASINAWIELCSVGSGPGGTITPGLYPVRVFGSGVGNANNAYSLKAEGTPPSGETIRFFALDRMSIFSNLDTGATDFFLAEVEDVHAGKDFVVTLFDPGDANPGVNNDITFVGPGGVDWTGGCRIEAAPAGPGSPAYSEIASPSGLCTFDATRPANDYNGRWIRVTIPLGGGYACAGTADDPDCWWKVRYDYAGQAHDRTTWEAAVRGSLVSLVFDDETSG